MVVLPEKVKENPLKSLAATVAAAGVILTAVFTIDGRYAHAGDVVSESVKQQRQIVDLQANNLEDKIFELELRKTSKSWQPTDQVLLDRYKRRFMEVDKLRAEPAKK